jgi:hypothetical protein
MIRPRAIAEAIATIKTTKRIIEIVALAFKRIPVISKAATINSSQGNIRANKLIAG